MEGKIPFPQSRKKGKPIDQCKPQTPIFKNHGSIYVYIYYMYGRDVLCELHADGSF